MSINVSIVILNYNTKDYTLACIHSVLKHTKRVSFEIIIVDNGSTDGSIAAFRGLRTKSTNLQIVQNKENKGFSGGNNTGIKRAKGEYVLLLNSDTKLHGDPISGMFAWMEAHKKVGVASCMLLNKDGTVQGNGGGFPTLLSVASWMSIEDLPFVNKLIKPFHPLQQKSIFRDDSYYKQYREPDWVTGAFLMIRRQTIETVGVLDEDYFMYTEDTDYCYRVRRGGWKIAYVPEYKITHFGGASSASEFPILSEFRGVKLFYKKHYPSWQYPFLRFFLKFGSLWRMVVFGVLEGKEARNAYTKAFREA